MTATRNRREQLLIDKGLQLRFVSRLCLILLADTLFFMTLAVTMPAAAGFLAGAPQWGVVEMLSRLDLLIFAVVLPLACSFLCLLGQGLRETLKIAGPDHRFRTVFSQLESLCIPRGVRIRKGDHLQATAKQLNAGLERLHDELAELKRLVQSDSANSAEQAPRIVDELRVRLERFTLVTFAPQCLPIGEDSATLPAKAVEPMEEPAAAVS